MGAESRRHHRHQLAGRTSLNHTAPASFSANWFVEGGAGALFLPKTFVSVTFVDGPHLPLAGRQRNGKDVALHKTLSSKTRDAALALVLSGLALPLAAPAFAQQDIQPLLSRIDRLERDVNMLQRQVYRGTTPGGAPMAVSPPDAQSPISAEARTLQLEEQMRALTGQVEEINNGLEQMKHRLDTLSSDIDQRFSALGGAPAATAGTGAVVAGTASSRTGAAAPPPAPEPAAAGSTPGTANSSGLLGTLRLGDDAAAPPQQATAPAALPTGTPQEQYNYAFGLLRRADYPGAEKALKSFVQRYPNDALAGNAQYWLGETYFVRKDYENAATAFALGYQKYPKSGKAADNLLKLGMSLGSLGKKQEACSAYARLDRDFPTAPANIKERQTSERQQLGCP